MRRTKWTTAELVKLACHHAMLGNKWAVLSRLLHKTDAQVKNMFHSVGRSKSGIKKCAILHHYVVGVRNCADQPEGRRAALQRAKRIVQHDAQQHGSRPSPEATPSDPAGPARSPRLSHLDVASPACQPASPSRTSGSTLSADQSAYDDYGTAQLSGDGPGPAVRGRTPSSVQMSAADDDDTADCSAKQLSHLGAFSFAMMADTDSSRVQQAADSSAAAGAAQAPAVCAPASREWDRILAAAESRARAEAADGGPVTYNPSRDPLLLLRAQGPPNPGAPVPGQGSDLLEARAGPEAEVEVDMVAATEAPAQQHQQEPGLPASDTTTTTAAAAASHGSSEVWELDDMSPFVTVAALASDCTPTRGAPALPGGCWRPFGVTCVSAGDHPSGSPSCAVPLNGCMSARELGQHRQLVPQWESQLQAPLLRNKSQAATAAMAATAAPPAAVLPGQGDEPDLLEALMEDLMQEPLLQPGSGTAAAAAACGPYTSSGGQGCAQAFHEHGGTMCGIGPGQDMCPAGETAAPSAAMNMTLAGGIKSEASAGNLGMMDGGSTGCVGLPAFLSAPACLLGSSTFAGDPRVCTAPAGYAPCVGPSVTHMSAVQPGMFGSFAPACGSMPALGDSLPGWANTAPPLMFMTPQQPALWQPWCQQPGPQAPSAAVWGGYGAQAMYSSNGQQYGIGQIAVAGAPGSTCFWGPGSGAFATGPCPGPAPVHPGQPYGAGTNSQFLVAQPGVSPRSQFLSASGMCYGLPIDNMRQQQQQFQQQ